MAEEKNIRVNVSGDASGLNKTMQRAQQEMRKTFSDVGLDDVLKRADSQFNKIGDKIKFITNQLEGLRNKQDDVFKERSGKGNAAYRNNIQVQQDQFEEKYNRAGSSLENFAKAFGVRVTNGALPVVIVPGSGGGSGNGGGSSSGWGNGGSGNLEEGDPTLDPEKNPKNKRNLFWQRVAASSIRGGWSGGTHEAVEGESGLAATLGGGATAAGLIGPAIAIAAAEAIRRGMVLGLDRSRAEGQMAGTFDNGGPEIDPDYTGMTTTEILKYTGRVARGRGFKGNIAEETQRRGYLMGARNLDEGEVGAFDQFSRQGSNDGTQIIAQILMRSEKEGILGVSKGDFSRLPESIQSVSSLLSIQKSQNETVNSDFAINLQRAGRNIGGRFGDERISESIGRISSNIANPASGGMRAYIYEMLRRANPNSSYTDILGKMEGGATAENLQAILPQIANMKQGEMRRRVLHQLTGNWQDANLLDSKNNLQEMLAAAKKLPGESKGELDSEFNKIRGQAKNNITGFDEATRKATNALTNFTTTLIESTGAGRKDFKDVTKNDVSLKYVAPGALALFTLINSFNQPSKSVTKKP